MKKINSKQDKSAASQSKPSASKLLSPPRRNGTVTNIEMTDRPSKVLPTKSKRDSTTSFNNNASSMSGKLSKCSFSWPTGHRTGTKDSCRTSISSPMQSSDIVSQTTLDSDQASMENNASSRSGHLTTSDFDGSNLGDSKGSKDRSGSNDYLDNFPYAPPSRKPIPRAKASMWSIKPK